jgi:hypothetical protein
VEKLAARSGICATVGGTDGRRRGTVTNDLGDAMGDQYLHNVVSMERRRVDHLLDSADDRWEDEPDDYPGSSEHEYLPDLGELTIRVFAGDDLLDTIRRPVGGSGYELAALGLRPLKPRPPRPRHERELTWLARLVGGTDALDGLGIDALPDEPLDCSGVREDLRARVAAIAARCDRVADGLHDIELRTACRRFLARAVSAEPELLLRSDRDDTAAGAVLHAVAGANGLLGRGRAFTASSLTEVCGLRSSPHGRAQSFAHAVAGSVGTGFGPHGDSRGEPDVLVLGSPDLLLGRFRAQLVRLRGLAHEERHQAVG